MKLFVDACHLEAKFIGMAAASKKPAEKELGVCVKPLAEIFNKISDYKAKFNRAPEFNCIAGIAEAVPVLNWIMVVY